MKVRTIIIDDEYSSRDLIVKLIQKLNINFEIIGTAENIDMGFDIISKEQPDLVFLDIKMPGGNGFQLLNRFEKPNFEVVFITGFDEYALQAFAFNALDYVLKPIDTTKLNITLNKVYERITSKLSIVNNFREIINIYNVDNHLISKIPVHHNDKVELLDIKEIISVEANEGCTVFRVSNNSEFVSSKQLSTFEFIFDKYSFFVRINKSTYVNTDFIRNYSKGSDCFIQMKNNQYYEVSRRKKTEILKILEGN
jgi:two-component system LytT family response regulator